MNDIPAPSYDAGDHYWIVAGDASRVFSSKTGDYVVPSNPAYQAWLAQGGQTTRIANEAELGEVLADARVRPVKATVLDAFKDRHAERLTLEIVAKLLLWLVNEVRSLKGQPAINAAQFRQFIKDQM